MLTSMRKHRKFLNIFLWIVIFAFLSTIIFVWGRGNNQDTPMNYAARVGDYVVTYNEYRKTHDRQVEQYKQLYGPNADQITKDPAFAKSVLDSIINSRLLLDEATRLKIPVSDLEVTNAIVKIPAFSQNGVFSTQLYQNILRANGYPSAAAFENEIRNELRLSKFQQIIMNTVSVNEDEIKNEYVYLNTTAEVSYFAVSDETYKKNVVIDPAKLNAFYQENQENYRLPQEIKLKYIKFTPESFDFKPTITDEAIQSRYTSTISNYTVPEALDLSIITAPVSDWNNSAEVTQATEKMQNALNELKSGKKFNAVADEYNMRKNGGIVGRINASPADRQSDIEKTVFALKSGEYSGIVKDEDGYYIYKADNHTEAVVRPLEAVKNEIRKTLEDEAKTTAYRNYLTTKYKEISTAGNITAYLKDKPDLFRVETTPMLAENDPSAFFQKDPELKVTLFTLGKTDISPLLDIDNVTYLYEVEDKINSHIPALNDIRAKVEADFVNRTAFEAALADVNQKIATVTVTGDNFAKAAAQFGQKIVKLKPIKRNDVVTDIPWAQDMAATIFRGAKDDVIKYPVLASSKIYVLHINDMVKPAMDNLSTEEAVIKSNLLSMKQAEALRALINDLKKKHKVVVNERFLQ